MKEDILSTCVSQLKTKVDSIMLDINGLLSKPYEEGVSYKVSEKIIELSAAELAYRQGLSLQAQAMAQRLAALASSVTSEITNEPKPEEGTNKW